MIRKNVYNEEAKEIPCERKSNNIIIRKNKFTNIDH